VNSKRERTATLRCSDAAWREFKTLAVESGTSVAQLLGDLVEDAVSRPASAAETTALFSAEKPVTTPEKLELPPRVLIGFGKPVVRIR